MIGEQHSVWSYCAVCDRLSGVKQDFMQLT